MFTQIAGIGILAVMFVIATALPINMGALALVASFIIGLLSNLAAKDILAGFPGDLFVTLVGITYLFAIAQSFKQYRRCFMSSDRPWLVAVDMSRVPTAFSKTRSALYVPQV